MRQQLVDRREAAMDRADRAVEAAWPERRGREFEREMDAAARTLEEIAAELPDSGADAAEQSRTWGYLGSVLADLAPARGLQMLERARGAYLRAEELLPEGVEALARAKLEFNHANTLRQLGARDPGLLGEAEARCLRAREVFAREAAPLLPQADEALNAIRELLRLTPRVAELSRELEDLSADITGARAAIAASSATPELEHGELLSKLRSRLEQELEGGRLEPARGAEAGDLLEALGPVLAGGDGELGTLVSRHQDLRRRVGAWIEKLHYLSHGLERPPAGCRAAELVERCWDLRRHLAHELNRPGKSERESARLTELNSRASKVDRRIYEAGTDDERARAVELESLRPLALEVRRFAARHHLTPARPRWPAERLSIQSTLAFYSGADDCLPLLVQACARLDLVLAEPPTGERYARARWNQLRRSAVALFDLRRGEAVANASVAYELGLALALGKALVVLSDAGGELPFDVDVAPVALRGDEDARRLGEALDRALVWAPPPGERSALAATLEHVLELWPRPGGDVHREQTLRLLDAQREAPDPLAVGDALELLAGLPDAGGLALLHPVWSPVYPAAGSRRLFHVMPFGPAWSRGISDRVRGVCRERDCEYVRGDQVENPRVVHSIWEELCRASHVLVDLTGFNSNVALELGLAHALGREVLMVGQGDTTDRLFPMIAKLRVRPYGTEELALDAEVARFLA